MIIGMVRLYKTTEPQSTLNLFQNTQDYYLASLWDRLLDFGKNRKTWTHQALNHWLIWTENQLAVLTYDIKPQQVYFDN